MLSPRLGRCAKVGFSRGAGSRPMARHEHACPERRSLMNMLEIGKDLVAKCNALKNLEVCDKYYSDDITSIEAMVMPGSASRETKGKAAVRGKGEWWLGAHEIHAAKAEGPFPHGDDRFAVIFDMDITNKESKQRMQMKEIGVFTVKGDKITREEFFYAGG